MADPKWPKGCQDLYYKTQIHGEKILTGLLIAIDPASGGTSKPGFAIFYAGELQTCGTIDLPKKSSVFERLQVLTDKIKLLTPAAPDVFAVELIRGRMAHVHLTWSVGATISAARTPIVIEVNIPAWHALAKAQPTYTKGDAADAVLIGRTVIELAKRSRK